jgi:hypothetical protein
MGADLLELLAEQRPPAAIAARLGLRADTLTLRRAWPRSADQLLVEYQAGGQLVPGQWHRGAEAGMEAVRGLPEDDSAAFPVTGGAGWLALQLRGADRRLPGLAPLLSEPGATLIVHQPGRRAVVRLAKPGSVRYAKLVPPKRAPGLAEAGRTAMTLGDGLFATPRLIACEPERGLLLWSELRGIAMSELPGGGDLEQAARLAGGALAALHAAEPPQAVRAHGPCEEIAMLERWAGFAAQFAPAYGACAQALLPELGERLAALPTLRRTVHRDFYDKQVIVSAGRAGLLDFDTLAVGDPALDLANALVHFELRALQGLYDEEHARAAAAALLDGYEGVSGAPGADKTERIGIYAAATRLRLACVYSFRPPWRRHVAALLRRLDAPVLG